MKLHLKKRFLQGNALKIPVIKYLNQDNMIDLNRNICSLSSQISPRN